MTDKRVLLAAFLSVIFIALYSQAMMKWFPAPKTTGPAPKIKPASSNGTSPALTATASILQPIEQEDIITIESKDIGLEIGKSSGAIRAVALKKFVSGTETLQISGTYPILKIQATGAELQWQVAEHAHDSATFLASDGNGNNYHILYELDSYNPTVNVVLTSSNSIGNLNELVLISSWFRGDELDHRRNPLELIGLFGDGKGRTAYRRYLAQGREKDVPRGTSLVSLSERYFCQSIKPDLGTLSVKLLSSPEGSISAESRLDFGGLEATTPKASLKIYFGPRDYFRLEKAGFKDAFPIGVLGQIGLGLLFVLSLIAGVTKNYGVAIILFSVFITCLMAPFTLLSFKSMKKKQEQKQQIDRITAQHKNDPTKANQEIFSLYKQHRVSPLSGCLPMVLQMPIFISLFQAISHFIELRGKSFLWIKDLSLPDRLARFPVSIPLLGSDLNALPLIMAAAMYLQTKASQGRMAQSQQDPTTRMLSGPTTSVVFGIMFYQFPAGLVLYWLTNSLMSMLWYRLAK